MVATSPRSSLTKAEVESAVRIYWSALAAKEAVRQLIRKSLNRYGWFCCGGSVNT
jgi:hypothetical protein